MKLIIHAGTGTIIPADECLVVTIVDDLLEDHEIVERAEVDGSPISELLSSNTMSFSPLALREEARELLGDAGYYKPEDTSEEAEAIRWSAYIATNDELNEVGHWIMNDDDLWRTFRTSFTEGIRWGHNRLTDSKRDNHG